MATYTELNALLKIDDVDNTALRQRIAIATMVKADTIRLETDDGTQAVRERKRFSKQIYQQSLANIQESIQAELNGAPLAFTSLFEAIYRMVLMANKAATVTQIKNATDIVIQNNVDDAVDHLAASYPDPVTP